jgi:hypothetical protein
MTGSSPRLTFYLNGFAYDAEKGEQGMLSFSDRQVWRLGSPNDEGWYRGQYRYSSLAPEWGEFYELTGEDTLSRLTDWQHPSIPAQAHGIFCSTSGTGLSNALPVIGLLHANQRPSPLRSE